MIKFGMGMALGAGIVYCFTTFPVQSKQAVKTGVDATTSMVAQASTAAAKAANEQLASKK
jgi:hypothetical protein